MANNKRAQLLKQQQEAAAKAAKRNRIIIAVSGVVVVALALVGIVMWQSNTPATPEGSVQSTGSATATDTGTASAPATLPADIFIPPNGTAEMGYIEVEADNVSPDALTVDEQLDYQCPYCHLADSVIGPSFRALAERGDIILRVHIRSFLDSGLKNDSSTRAAIAATCADTVGDFIAYHETVFANQPPEGVGYTDQQLRVDFAAQAGITGADLTAFQTCYDSQQTLGYVQAMEQVNSTSRTINGADQDPAGGTPAFYVNGTPLLLNQMVGVNSDNSWYPKVDTSPDGFLAFLKTIPA